MAQLAAKHRTNRHQEQQSAMEDLQVADDRGATSGGALVARARTFG